MAKTGKDKKQETSEKSNLVKSSSNQKENRPKKGNVNRNHNDNIGMSKQLMMKSAQKSRSKRKPPGAMRVMPTLADLEKMFEESDEEMDVITSAGPSCQNLSNPNHNTAPTFSLPQELSHTSEVLANTEPITYNEPSHTPDDVKLLSPPRKRVKLDTEFNDIDELPPIMISPSKKCTINSESILTENGQIETCQNNIKSDVIPVGDKEIEEREQPIYDNGHVSGNRTDSNKTIEHNLTTSVSKSITVSEAFSPKPSTSKDIKTISANDKLFSRSLQLKNSNDANETQTQTITQMVESFTPPVIIDDDVLGEPPIKIVQRNEAQTVQSSTSLVIIDDSVTEEPSMNTVHTNEARNLTQTVESSIPSVIIDDSVIEETPINIVPKIDNDLEIIELHTTQINPTNTTKTGDRKLNNNDDDDCVFVETHPSTIRAAREVPEVIDLEYSFMSTDNEQYYNNTDFIEDDVIDVDAIIALNQSVLNKYTTPGSRNSRFSNNLVVDVVNTTIHEYPSNQNTQNRNENQPNGSVSSESQPQTGKQIEFTANFEVVTSTSGQKPTNRNHTGEGRTYSRRIVSRDVANFFNRNHRRNPNQIRNIQNESQRPFTLFCNPLLDLLDIRSINVPDSTPPHPQTSTSCPSTQATTSSQKTQHATSNSQKSQSTPNTSVPTFNNDIPTSPPKSSEKGCLGDCPICMDRLSSKQIASTICGHIFCFSCIETAIKSNKRCPTCRKMLKNNGFHKIFL